MFGVPVDGMPLARLWLIAINGRAVRNAGFLAAAGAQGDDHPAGPIGGQQDALAGDAAKALPFWMLFFRNTVPRSPFPVPGIYR